MRISDLDSWLKTPSIYVFDCSAAGMIINAFIEVHILLRSTCLMMRWSTYLLSLFSNQAICVMQLQNLTASNSSGPSTRDCILLAACEAHETLPQSAEFPADVFTSCLTTPIKMALRWYLLSEKVVSTFCFSSCFLLNLSNSAMRWISSNTYYWETRTTISVGLVPDWWILWFSLFMVFHSLS